MTPSKKIGELYAEGYQLTPEAYDYLNSLQEVENVINKILDSNLNKAILSIADIDEFLIADIIKKEEILEQPLSKKEETKKQEQEQEIQLVQEKKETKEEEVKSEIRVETKSRREKISSDLEIIFSPEIQKSVASAANFRNYFKSRFK